MPRLKIYRASAGSGKTFQLVREYLLIVLAEPEEYKHILGVTFTNKSTAEMKQRIVSELVRLAAGQSSGHLPVLMQALKLEESAVRSRAQTALRFILHDYSHLWISTIDSFFHRMIRSFARDIGLSAGYNLEMDTGRVLEESVERLIGDLDAGNMATPWVIDLALERVREGKNWNFRKELMELGREVFKEKFQMKEEEILNWVSDQERIRGAYTRLVRIRQAFEATLSAWGKKGMELMRSKGLSPEDFPYKTSSFAALFRKLEEGRMEPPGVRAREAADHIEAWYSKNADEGTKGIAEDIYHAGLNRLLVEIISFYDRQQQAYHTAVACLEYFHQFVLISDIQRYIRDYRDENEVMLISDTASFISKVMGENEESFVFEKAGNYFHHYLIDEFQDTSVLQWNNFKPLLSNSISQNYVSLLVGDVKQSIYRFRNGDWRLLLYKAMQDIPYHEAIHLNTNYRSDAWVVRFNNALFDTLPGLMAQAYHESFKNPDDSRALAEENMGYFIAAYEGQRQALPEGKDFGSGYVSLRFIETTEDRKWKEAVLESLPERLNDIFDRGYPPSGIAILVRDTNDASLVYHALLEAMAEGKLRYSFDLLTERSLGLSGSPVVRLILAAMYFLHDQRDQLHLAQVRSEYYGYLQSSGSAITQHALFVAGGGALFEGDPVAVFLKRVPALRQLALPDMVSELVQLFGLDRHPMQIAFLQAFQDMLLDYQRDHDLSLPAFLDWWETSGSRQTISSPESGNAVWIMTIHKSKGLEFPVVLLPFCDWPADHLSFHTQILWSSLNTEAFSDLPMVPVKYTSRLEETLLAQDYADEKMSAYLDNLNLLYVALTRAVHELYVFAEYKPADASWKTMGQLLLTSVQIASTSEEDDLQLSAHWNEEERQLELGSRRQFSGEGKTSETFSLQRFMQSPYKPALLFRRTTTLPEEEDRVGRGNLVHEALFRLRHPDDLDRVLQALQTEGLADENIASALRTELSALFRSEQVRQWFDGQHKVWKERRLLDTEGSILIPDRVVETDSELWVIDFKSGTKSDGHILQVQGYMGAIRRLSEKPVRGFIMYTAHVEVIEV